jgi:proteasome activator subunit 4
MHIRHGLFVPQLEKILAALPEWKTERPHGPKDVLSDHDTAGSTSTWRTIRFHM